MIIQYRQNSRDIVINLVKLQEKYKYMNSNERYMFDSFCGRIAIGTNMTYHEFDYINTLQIKYWEVRVSQ